LLEKEDLNDEVCGGEVEITNEKVTEITSPNYPFQYDPNIRCNYLIKSPNNTRITLKIIDLDLEETNSNSCVDGLELRYYHLGQPGPIYCGRLDASQEFTVNSYSNTIMIIFRSDWGQEVRRRGFKLNLFIKK
jgi:hypothetical protein